ncbi:MAG: aspartate/glutamate racemase family protein [Gammaproteobacteria bacterium]|nr:aspartate/glutamate racemase family protein [Gammaproteobacteria bacterium]
MLIRNRIAASELVVGVIAGTPIDTRFGVSFLEGKQIRAYGLSISDTPQEQTGMQALNREALTELVLLRIGELLAAGVNALMIYCNSLSGALDLEALRARLAVPLITPLDVYAELAGRYRKFGLLAANCQSCANIERLLLERDSQAKVIGVGNLQIVEDIEKGYAPAAILRDHALVELGASLRMSGVEILILACTHFHYFYRELQGQICLEIFEPSEQMVVRLENAVLRRAA